MEKERKEKEKQERLEKKRIERERKEKEKLEKLEQEKIERERLEKLEQEKREKIRLGTAGEFDKPRDSNENRRNTKQRFLNVEKNEKHVFATTPKYELRHKFKRFIPEEQEINKEDIKEGEIQNEINIWQKPIKNLYITKNNEIMQRNRSLEEINSEEIKKEKRQSKMLSDSNEGESDSINRKMIYQKKKLSRIDNEDKKEQIMDEENKYIKKFKNIVVNNYENVENEKDEEDSSIFRKKNLTVKHNDTLISNLSETFQRGGRPTKIKIYKCVVYKNLDPSVNEETIKSFMRRSGSQIFTNGGFIVKLPQNKTYKPKHGFI